MEVTPNRSAPDLWVEADGKASAGEPLLLRLLPLGKPVTLTTDAQGRAALGKLTSGWYEVVLPHTEPFYFSYDTGQGTLRSLSGRRVCKEPRGIVLKKD